MILGPLLNPILPVFAIVAIGYALGRAGHTTVDEARALNRFALTFLLPVLIFGLLVDAPIREFRPTPILAYAATELAVFLVGLAIATKLLHRPLAEAILLAMAGVFSNTVLYVLPLSILLYGEDNVLPMTAIITLDSTVTFGGAMIAMEVVTKGRLGVVATARRLLTTPLLIAILAGFAFNAAAVGLPDTLRTFVEFNGAAAAPVALFALGVVLSQTPLKPDAASLTFTAIKLAAFPLAVALVLATVAPEAPRQYILGAAGPAGAMAFSLALLYGVPTAAIARTIIYTSVLTLVTLAALA